MLTKSTLVWHKKDSAKYQLCNGAKFGKFKWCFDHVWKLPSLKETTIQQKQTDSAKSENSGEWPSLEVNKTTSNAAILYNMHQSRNLDVQASQWYYLHNEEWQEAI